MSQRRRRKGGRSRDEKSSLQRADRREKESRRCKNLKDVNISESDDKTRAGLRFGFCRVLCARLPRYFWQHPTMPACYHNEAINVKQLPHKLSGSTHWSEKLKIASSLLLEYINTKTQCSCQDKLLFGYWCHCELRVSFVSLWSNHAITMLPIHTLVSPTSIQVRSVPVSQVYDTYRFCSAR